MKVNFLWLLCFGIFLQSTINYADDSYQVTQKPKPQIVFLADYRLDRRNPVLSVQKLTAFHLIDFIKQSFEAEFSVAGFVDYPDTATPKAVTNPELCYFLMQEPTADKEKIMSAILKNIFPIPGSPGNWSNHAGDVSESVTTAMLFSAVDKRLRWNSGFYDKQGNLVRKIMIPMTFHKCTLELKTPGNRKPTLEQLNNVLFDNKFTVVNSLTNMPGLNVYLGELYGNLFSSLYVPYYQAAIPKNGQLITQEINSKFDYKAYAKSLYDIIMQEVMRCDWEDPIGYNTLGL